MLFSIAVSSCKKDQSGVTQADATPVITSINPKNPQPGDVVTITGTGFGSVAADVKVTIGTQVIMITTVSDTQIKLTLPANITAGDLALAIKNITATNADPQGVTITPQPAPVAVTVLTVSPAQAKVGDLVTVLGTGFSTTIADNVLKFNGATAVIQSITGGGVQVLVPEGATTGPISISVKGGATITGPQFTLDATTTGNGVDYVNVISGTAKFSKFCYGE